MDCRNIVAYYFLDVAYQELQQSVLIYHYRKHREFFFFLNTVKLRIWFKKFFASNTSFTR